MNPLFWPLILKINSDNPITSRAIKIGKTVFILKPVRDLTLNGLSILID